MGFVRSLRQPQEETSPISMDDFRRELRPLKTSALIFREPETWFSWASVLAACGPSSSQAWQGIRASRLLFVLRAEREKEQLQMLPI